MSGGATAVLPPIFEVSLRGQLHVCKCGTSSRDSMERFLRRLRRTEDGLSATEYAVMLALIIMVCFSAAQTLGCTAKITFNNVASSMGN